MSVPATTPHEYDVAYYRYRESTRDFRIEARLACEAARAAPGRRVLEVGCGGGALLEKLCAMGCSASGVDCLTAAVEAARDRAPGARVLQGEATGIPFAGGSFDSVISQHLIEHLPSCGAALREWMRVLRPGGALVVLTPNRLYPAPEVFADPSHVKIFAPDELELEVSEAGYGDVCWKTVFPYLVRPRVSVGIGVPMYGAFRRLPGFRRAGRTIVLSATAPGDRRED